MEECKNPLIRVLLTNDGSMTIALEAILSSKLSASVLPTEVLDSCDFFDFPVIRREVVLESMGRNILHAVSYISKDFYDEMGFGTEVPIGLIMKKFKVEQYRDVYNIVFETIDSKLSELLGIDQENLYRRSYYVYIRGNRKLHITETLLPELIHIINNFN